MADNSQVTQATPESGETIQQTTDVDDYTRTLSHGLSHHSICYSFIVRDLRTKGSCAFQENFNIECDVLSTSWYCNMLFKKVAEDNTGCIIFKLKRIDNARETVKVSALLDIQDVTTLPLFTNQGIGKDSVRSGETIGDCLIKKFLIPEEAGYFDMKLYVRISICILYCHSDPESD